MLNGAKTGLQEVHLSSLLLHEGELDLRFFDGAVLGVVGDVTLVGLDLRRGLLSLLELCSFDPF